MGRRILVRVTNEYLFLIWRDGQFELAQNTRGTGKARKLIDLVWNPMDLRHSFAVNFLAGNGDIRELQRVLGHDNVFDTKRLYGEAVTKRIVEATVDPFEVSQ